MLGIHEAGTVNAPRARIRGEWNDRSVLIRRAREDDARAIAAVHIRSRQVGYRGLVPDDALESQDLDERTGEWQPRLRPDDPERGITLVAEDDDGIRGFVRFGPARYPEDGDGVGEVMTIYVDPDAWGTGIGHRLLTEAVAGLTEDGWPEAVLWALAENARACRFYEAHGWRRDLETVSDRYGLPVPLARYRIALGDC